MKKSLEPDFFTTSGAEIRTVQTCTMHVTASYSACSELKERVLLYMNKHLAEACTQYIFYKFIYSTYCSASLLADLKQHNGHRDGHYHGQQQRYGQTERDTEEQVLATPFTAS